MRLRIAFIALLLLILPLSSYAGAEDSDRVFEHQVHLEEYEPDCATCHLSTDLDVVPSLERCQDCHETEFIDGTEIPGRTTHDSFWYRDHGSLAKQENSNCTSCHNEPECLDCHKAGFADEQGMINVHRSDFRVTHPIMAREDSRSCNVCHEEQRFCNSCHEDFSRDDLAVASHRRSFSDLSAGLVTHETFSTSDCQTCHPDSVLPSHNWTSDHAREARRSLPACQACHPQAEVCLTCHSAREGLMVNPHPGNWDDMKDILNGAGGGKTCRRCH
jgi:hypothetical protein